MIKEDEILKKIFKSIDVEIEPADGTKQRIYQRLLYESNQQSLCYSPYFPWFSEKILKLIIPIWILVSILMTISTTIIAF